MMLSFFKTRPPLSAGQRVSIELLMRRTIDAVGDEIPRHCQLVQSIADLRLDSSPLMMLKQAELAIANRIPSSPDPVGVVVSQQIDGELPSVYHQRTVDSPARIELQRQTLDDPLRTVLELSNQYSNHFWHTCGQLNPEQIHPNLTHLLPICCGLGVLSSEGSFYDLQWSSGGWHGWAMSRAGYYNASEIGYASAVLARHRGERNPTWFKSMRLDSRDTAKRATRYFELCQRIGRSILFDAENIPSIQSDPSELAGWLAGTDEHFALAAAYVLVKTKIVSPLIIDAALHAVQGKNQELVPMALRLLAMAKPVTDQIQTLIKKQIAHPSHAISIAALQSADSLGMAMPMFRDRIAQLLQVYAEGSLDLIEIVAKSAAEFESLDLLICRHLIEAIKCSNDPATTSLIACLNRISADPRGLIEREVADPELKAKAINAMTM